MKALIHKAHFNKVSLYITDAIVKLSYYCPDKKTSFPWLFSRQTCRENIEQVHIY